MTDAEKAEIAKYATTIDGEPWEPFSSLPKKEQEKRWKKARKIAEEWRKAVNADPEARRYYTELENRGR